MMVRSVLKKIKAGKRELSVRVLFTHRGFRKSFSDEVVFQQRPEGVSGADT